MKGSCLIISRPPDIVVGGSDVNKTTSLKTKTKTEEGKSNTKNKTNVIAADNVSAK